MPIPLLLAFLVAILPSSTLGQITNDHLDILDYAYIRAIEAGINPISFIKLIHCESRFDKTAKGDWRSEDKIYLSKGILQFQKPTYEMFSKKYGLEGTWLSPYSQINLASAMLRDGLWRQWFNCAKSLKF